MCNGMKLTSIVEYSMNSLAFNVEISVKKRIYELFREFMLSKEQCWLKFLWKTLS